MQAKSNPSVCHLAQIHEPKDVRIFHREALSLARAGYRVTILAPGGTGETAAGVRLAPAPVPRRRLGSYTLDILLRTDWMLWRRAAAERADIYHLHEAHLLFIGLLLKWSGKRVIYDAHEYAAGEILESKRWTPGLRRAVAATFDWVEKWAVRKFDGVIGATPYITATFSDRGIPATNVNNYPLPAEYESISIHTAAPEGRVVYVGYLSEIRGLLEILEAIDCLQTKVTICGSFDTPAFQAKCLAHRNWAKVDYLGHVPRAKAQELTRTAIAGLVVFQPSPNNTPSQPNKLFEYMSLGLPVICSNFPGWKALVDQHDCGICVDPLNPKAIAAAVNRLVNDPRERQRLGENGRRLVLEQFNWKREQNKLLELYSRLCPLLSSSAALAEESALRVGSRAESAGGERLGV